MIAAEIGDVFEVQMPTDVQQFINAIKIAVSFGVKLILEMTPLACLGLGGYSAEMLFWIIAPLGLSGCIFVGAACWLCARKQTLTLPAVLSIGTPLVLKILFLAHPLVQCC